jgi:hypothetical protein
LPKSLVSERLLVNTKLGRQGEVMEETPPFDSAVQRLQRFLAEQGWPTRLVWRTDGDIVHVPSGDVVVRRRVEGEAASAARKHYDEGLRQGGGIALEVPCEVDGAACTTVYWTTDVVEAGYRMLPDHGLKLSVATQHPTGSGVGILGWWLASQRRKRWDAAVRSASRRATQQTVAADEASPRR